MKKSFIAMLLIALLAVCLCVSCNDDPAASGDKWVCTYSDTETDEEGTYDVIITATLEFDGKGGVTMTTHLDSMKMGGVEMIDLVPEAMRTDVMTGTYTDTEITFTYKEEEGITVTEKGTYTISGNKLTVTAEGETHVFTKQ